MALELRREDKGPFTPIETGFTYKPADEVFSEGEAEKQEARQTAANERRKDWDGALTIVAQGLQIPRMGEK